MLLEPLLTGGVSIKNINPFILFDYERAYYTSMI